jgi:hypothetical protein
MLKERNAGVLTGRNVKVALMLAAVPISIAAGYYTPRAYDAVMMGKSASSVARQLGCTGFKQEPSHTFHGTTVRITTFDRANDRSAYDQTLKVVEANNSKLKNGAYASGEGWNVVDANNFTSTVASAVVGKLGGATYAIPTVTRRASASPSASAKPSTVPSNKP